VVVFVVCGAFRAPERICPLCAGHCWARKGLAFWLFGTNGTEKDVILKNEAEMLLKTNDRLPKTNLNEPKNEAEKLLKIRSCGKNEPKTNLKRSYR
jgi:hypothetical protein